ncbi:MAG: hypothetical protein HYS13_17815 [Planctomycetia bacterium]|nr:hypothetical protein [Planctomycetia bacterium]
MRGLASIAGVWVAALPLIVVDVPASADDAPSDKEVLKPLQVYIGAWKGVGQPKRGSTEGTWIEKSDWAWKFDKGQAQIVFDSPEGKYFQHGRIVTGDKQGELKFIGTLPDDKTEIAYTAKAPAGDEEFPELVFAADKRAADRPARISIRMVAKGDRLLVLYEKRVGETDRYLRLAEVGSTRAGSDFGKGTTGRECIITGGAGTIPVTHKGQTYYVCCTGCRDLFNEDPDAAIAEYVARKKAEKEKKK